MIYRLAFFVIGLFVLAFGVTLTIQADLGAGAWDALNVGLTDQIGLTVGSWIFIVGILVILLNAIIMREAPKVLGVFTILLVGFFVDFWMLYVFQDFSIQNMMLKVVILLSGILLIAIGVSIYLQTSFPANPIDQLMITLHKRFGFSLMAAKTIGEVGALVLALLFAGPIGLGTIIITFAIGPLIQVCNAPVSAVMGKWIPKT
ncbi:YczE/YyaS/YitT family protein [Metabacillus idriensis]|uniref:YczE/YyaS/YitT family protein n=1 Tax=Metabacillus idriensis TaxID=324768 RepID=UPI001CD57784|nr:membrane protein [Metabacillus idriensis]